MADEDAWSRVALFQSRDVLARRYHARHGKELAADKAAAIIAHLEQARQYFRSAEMAGVLAAPLEQYYGVLAFSRAIILFAAQQLVEADLEPAHGLSAVVPACGVIENVIIKSLKTGTFPQLVKWTGNRPGRAIGAKSAESRI